MKEQLFEILHNRHRMPGERFSDIEGKIEHLVNQEVEKRIAERMPSEEDIELYASLSFPFEKTQSTNTYGDEFNRPKRFGFKKGIDWLRSRLAKDGAESSQKTEQQFNIREGEK